MRQRVTRLVADVAEDQGVERQALVDALVAEAEEHLAEHVERDGLTEEQAAERRTELRERVEALVDREGLPLGRGHRGPDRDAAEDAPVPSRTS